jgi:tRNA 2-thiouridine synthesizing protein A
MRLNVTDKDSRPHQCDARYLLCPLPVLKARRLLLSMPKGGVIEVLATDPKSEDEFKLFCADEGYLFLGARKNGDVYHITVLKE